MKQEVTAGENSENYLSANDIHITKNHHSVDEEDRIVKIKNNIEDLFEMFFEKFNSIASEIIKSNKIERNNEKYYISDLKGIISNRLENDRFFLEEKKKDIEILRVKLMELGEYPESFDHDPFKIIGDIIEKDLELIRKKEVRKEKLVAYAKYTFVFLKKYQVVILSLLTILFFSLSAVYMIKYWSLDNELSYQNQRLNSVFEENNSLKKNTGPIHHDMVVMGLSDFDKDRCASNAERVMDSYKYQFEHRYSDPYESSLWMTWHDSKIQIKCDVKTKTVSFVIIDRDKAMIKSHKEILNDSFGF